MTLMTDDSHEELVALCRRMLEAVANETRLALALAELRDFLTRHEAALAVSTAPITQKQRWSVMAMFLDCGNGMYLNLATACAIKATESKSLVWWPDEHEPTDYDGSAHEAIRRWAKSHSEIPHGLEGSTCPVPTAPSRPVGWEEQIENVADELERKSAHGETFGGICHIHPASLLAIAGRLRAALASGQAWTAQEILGREG